MNGLNFLKIESIGKIETTEATAGSVYIIINDEWSCEISHFLKGSSGMTKYLFFWSFFHVWGKMIYFFWLDRKVKLFILIVVLSFK